ncbi:UNVERIFIED_CONTAM: hypothetical protein Sindi_2947300 [Sesamum indicum]
MQRFMGQPNQNSKCTDTRLKRIFAELDVALAWSWQLRERNVMYIGNKQLVNPPCSTTSPGDLEEPCHLLYALDSEEFHEYCELFTIPFGEDDNIVSEGKVGDVEAASGEVLQSWVLFKEIIQSS